MSDKQKNRPRNETFYRRSYNSPLGAYVLVSSSRGLVGIKSNNASSSLFARWEKDGIRIKADTGQNDSIMRELDDYFAEKRIRFSVSLDLRGTDFQLRVWRELQTIPYGGTCSYGQIARAIGRPTASRAVGRANHTNPVAIVVPCHRVIGADGGLVGYGGGIDRKQALLDLEARVSRRQLRS